MNISGRLKKYACQLQYSLLFVTILSYHSVITRYQGDDMIFSDAARKYGLFDWIGQRYHEWSGRVFPDAMAHFFFGGRVWLWPIINTLFIILGAVALIKLCQKKVNPKHMALTVLLFGMLSQSTLSASFFWITGSFNYLWPTVMGLYALIPFANTVYQKNYQLSARTVLLTIFTGILAGLGNEQVGACVVSFAGLTVIYLFITKKNFDKKILLIFLASFVALFISVTAPGNQIRITSEIAFWYPDFNKISFLGHIKIGISWFYTKLFTSLGAILLLISITTLLLYRWKVDFKNKWNAILFAGLLGQTTLVIVLKCVNKGQDLFYNFYPIENVQRIRQIFTYGFWSVFMILLILALLKVVENKILILLSFAAAWCSMAIMFFSPTIYGSGDRTLMVSGIIFIFIELTLLFSLKHTVPKKVIYTVCLIIALYSLYNLGTMFSSWYFNGFNPYM